MPSLDTAIQDLNQAAHDLAEQYAKREEAQKASNEAWEKVKKEHDEYWGAVDSSGQSHAPSERDINDLRNAESSQNAADAILRKETNTYDQKLRAFLMAQQAF